MTSMTYALVVMGPCGCGKSEVGQMLATTFDTTFLDADAFHPVENVRKMAQGIPLTDQDRTPWLETVRREMLKEIETRSESSCQKSGGNRQVIKIATVLGCSALRRHYRDILRGKGDLEAGEGNHFNNKLIFILLNCSRTVLEERLQSRSGHFMKSSMLESQLETLELPEGEELQDFVVVNGDLPLTHVVQEITTKLSSIIGEI